MKKLEPILWVIAMLKNVTGNVTVSVSITVSATVVFHVTVTVPDGRQYIDR